VRRAITAGYVKRSLVGKPPVGKPQKALGRALVKGEQALLKADRRYPALRDPRVARLRSRLGLL